MKLYHFTSFLHAPKILEMGLSIGDVPTSPEDGFNAVWLTLDENPKQQQWGDGRSIAGTKCIDKTVLRLTVEIDESDLRLQKWEDIAALHGVDSDWYDILNETGGGGARLWYIYRGIIPPEWITEWKQLREATKSEIRLMEASESGKSKASKGVLMGSRIISIPKQRH